jgi:hypothetical protein
LQTPEILLVTCSGSVCGLKIAQSLPSSVHDAALPARGAAFAAPSRSLVLRCGLGIWGLWCGGQSIGVLCIEFDAADEPLVGRSHFSSSSALATFFFKVAHLSYLGYNQSEGRTSFIICSPEVIVEEIDRINGRMHRTFYCRVLVDHALNACPPPIPPGTARTPWSRPKVGGLAERAIEARLSPSRPPYPRAFLARSLALTAHAAVWLSGARLQVAARGKLRSGTAPCDRKLVQWCAHPSATLAHRQLALTARSPAHPLVPYPQPYFTPTYEPLGPDPAAM